MFSTRGALDALAVAAHRHDAVPSLRGERDPAAEAPADDEAAEPAPAPPADDAEAAATLAAEAALAASAAYSTPACDWTTPFPVTASAAVSVGEVSLFALGLVDGTVLVLDARLGLVAARLDRLGAVRRRRRRFRSPSSRRRRRRGRLFPVFAIAPPTLTGASETATDRQRAPLSPLSPRASRWRSVSQMTLAKMLTPSSSRRRPRRGGRRRLYLQSRRARRFRKTRRRRGSRNRAEIRTSPKR